MVEGEKWKLIARHFKLVSREGFFFLSAHLEGFHGCLLALCMSSKMCDPICFRDMNWVFLKGFWKAFLHELWWYVIIHRESVKILMNHEWFYQICALSLLFKPWNDHREQIHWCACFVCRMVWTVWAILNANEAWNPAWMIVLQSSSFPGRVKKREPPNFFVETCLGAPCFALVLPLPCLPQRFCASCRLPSFSRSDQTGDTMSACPRMSLWTWRRPCLVWQLATRTSRRLLWLSKRKRWRRRWLSRRWRWWAVQRSDTDICNTNSCPWVPGFGWNSFSQTSKSLPRADSRGQPSKVWQK